MSEQTNSITSKDRILIHPINTCQLQVRSGRIPLYVIIRSCPTQQLSSDSYPLYDSACDKNCPSHLYISEMLRVGQNNCSPSHHLMPRYQLQKHGSQINSIESQTILIDSRIFLRDYNCKSFTGRTQKSFGQKNSLLNYCLTNCFLVDFVNCM